jgi:DNA-binding response OmpR family regulator
MYEPTTTPHLLIAVEDPNLGDTFQSYTEEAGFQVTCSFDGREALSLLVGPELRFTAALLDVRLPIKDGFSVLQDARYQGMETPVLLVTREAPDPLPLRLATDDFLFLPIQKKDLLAHIHRALNRARENHLKLSGRQRFRDGLEVNFDDRSVSRQGASCRLTGLEYEVLCYLIRHRNRTATRQQILRDVWNYQQEIQTRTIDRHVASLRKKIEQDPMHPLYIAHITALARITDEELAAGAPAPLKSLIAHVKENLGYGDNGE